MMTLRDRMLAFMQGRETDRIPFAQYSNIAPWEELTAVLGPGRVGQIIWVTAHRFENTRCQLIREEIQTPEGAVINGRLITPEGTLTQTEKRDPALGSIAITEHFIKSETDYKILLAYFRDIKVQADREAFDAAVATLGENGLPHTWVGRTAYQQLWTQWVCIEELACHMADDAALVAEVVAEIERILREIVGVVRDMPLPYLVVGDNITAPMIGAEKFRKYCLPMYAFIHEALDGRNIPLVVHMDGDLKPLWDAIADARVDAIDSFSPPPDNDTSVAEALEMWPDKKLMVNFPSSVHLESIEGIRAKTREILNEGGRTGRLQMQVSEDVPPGRWRISYPAILDTIENFS